jgi:hypothetical protein
MGGSDDPSNIIELTNEEHALAHKKLYEEHGRWQDKVAWKGLAKLIGQEEILSECARRGQLQQAKNWPKGTRGHWKYPKDQGLNFKSEKTYEITFPDGKQEIVFGLAKFCRDNELNVKSFHKGCIERGSKHKGYSAKKIAV